MSEVKVLTDPLDAVERLSESVVTIGTYDGLHFGHRRIMELLVKDAQRRSLPSVVVTFDRHPLSLLRPASAPLRLASASKQLELLSELGVDLVYQMTFDQERAEEEPLVFMDKTLRRLLGAVVVYVGEDFRFGRERSGNFASLSAWADSCGSEARAVPLFRVGECLGASHRDAERVISSSLVRRYLEDGLLEDANGLLCRVHSTVGRVVGGDHRGGGELGFPTANLEIPAGLAVPKDGVYGGFLRRCDSSERHLAAISVGTRPTYYEDGERLIESFVLDFAQDLYGVEVEVGYGTYLREQEKFTSSEALILQIQRDVEAVRGRGSETSFS
jgi:riboflavin kinase/FMN adenylyltransferase